MWRLVIKSGKVTVLAGTAVGVLGAIGQSFASSVSVLIYAPQSEVLNLSIADSAGVPSDPTAMMPAQDNPFFVESIAEDIFLFNGGSASVTIVATAWKR